MTDSESNRWEVVKTILTFVSVVISAYALWQTHVNSRRQDDIANQTLSLQQQVFQRSQASVDFGLIQILLDHGAGDGKSHYYPDAGLDKYEHMTIPYEEWNSASVRYVEFPFANTGTASIFVDHIGVGVDKKNVTWADDGSRWCQNKADGFKWTDACPREIPAAGENLYVIALNKNLLQSVQQDWQADRFEVCVKVEAYGTICRTSWASLPEGFLSVVQ